MLCIWCELQNTTLETLSYCDAICIIWCQNKTSAEMSFWTVRRFIITVIIAPSWVPWLVYSVSSLCPVGGNPQTHICRCNERQTLDLNKTSSSCLKEKEVWHPPRGVQCRVHPTWNSEVEFYHPNHSRESRQVWMSKKGGKKLLIKSRDTSMSKYFYPPVDFLTDFFNTLCHRMENMWFQLHALDYAM